MVRFLAYSGTRLAEATALRWSQVDLAKKQILVAGTKTESSYRTVPIIQPLADLLGEIRGRRGDEPTDATVLAIRECKGALRTACSALKIKKLVHHDLRHFFATRCIESGVDIPTVSRWLGHGDGGALAMRTYGHLRVELVDCLIAFETCPDRAPKKLDPKLANLAWRMLHALKRGDSAWFRKLLAVREGEAFKRLSARGSVEAIDPLRAILAKLAQLQEDGRCGPVISIDELETFVAQRNGSAVPSDVKALRRAAREVGVKLAFKRGPKSGPRIDHGIN